MLAAIRDGLSSCVAAEVHSELAKTYCGFGIEFLDKLLIRYTAWPDILRRQIRRQIDVLHQSCEQLTPDIRSQAENALRVLDAQPAGTLEHLEQLQHRLNTALEQVFPVLLTRSTVDTVERINRLLREQIASVSDSERDFNTAIKARVERHSAITGSRVAVTREKLQDYLRARFPERGNIEITSFLELPGGSSSPLSSSMCAASKTMASRRW